MARRSYTNLPKVDSLVILRRGCDRMQAWRTGEVRYASTDSVEARYDVMLRRLARRSDDADQVPAAHHRKAGPRRQIRFSFSPFILVPFPFAASCMQHDAVSPYMQKILWPGLLCQALARSLARGGSHCGRMLSPSLMSTLPPTQELLPQLRLRRGHSSIAGRRW